MSGVLYIVGTPIGNLGDISERALDTLINADIIACEDTRHTIKLLNHFNISNTLVSYHEHNKITKLNELINSLKDGKNIALVSDAGMPCISDPGYELVNACQEEGIKVTTIPSGTAVVSGLILSGINSNKYIFEGFMSRNNKERLNTLNMLKLETRTTVFYESPHHIKQTLKDLQKTIPNRELAVVREITKIYEEAIKGDATTLLEHFEKNTPRGEMVLVVSGEMRSVVDEEKAKEFSDITILDHYNDYLSKGVNYKDAIKKVAKDRNLNKREVYEIINIKGEQ